MRLKEKNKGKTYQSHMNPRGERLKTLVEHDITHFVLGSTYLEDLSVGLDLLLSHEMNKP